MMAAALRWGVARKMNSGILAGIIYMECGA